MRVLLVSHHKMLVKTLKQGLEEEGFVVAVALQGREANGSLPSGDHAAIVLDLMNPKEDNAVRLAAWRRAGLKSPVIALAAPEGRERNNPNLYNSEYDCLIAPFKMEDLLARLRAVAGVDD
jgi:two-component system copper resistance phosphate regulon response regulator CusR